MAKTHKIALSPDVVARVTKRRGGKLHAFDRLDPAKTALIVIDMQNVWVKEGMPAYTPYCEAIVPNINLLARAIRDAGGSVWWVRAIYGDDAPRTWSAYMEFLSPEFLGDMLGALTEGEEGAMLWYALDVQPGDQHVIKRRFSALIQGSSDLLERLQAAGIDTVIITGTATNICCESTARDAFMLNYRTLVVSDANATVSDEVHNASLNALFMRFADVFTTAEVVDLLTQPTRNARQRRPSLSFSPPMRRVGRLRAGAAASTHGASSGEAGLVACVSLPGPLAPKPLPHRAGGHARIAQDEPNPTGPGFVGRAPRDQ